MDLLKGTLDILILKTLSCRAMHGYAIARSIRETSSEVLRVEEGALYPALRRLEKRDLLRSRWDTTETGRQAKFYDLTEVGRHHLRRALGDWDRYVAAMGSVLHDTGAAQ